MVKKKLLRICAAVIVIAMCAGVISSIVLVNNKTSETQEAYEDNDNIPKADNGISFKQSQAENLKFKIGELWRLSLNSNLDEDVKNVVNKLNQKFETEKLAEAVVILAEDFDVVANVYIESIQLEINFDMYLNDRDFYEQAKSEINFTDELLTIDRIDEYLNMLNTEEAKNLIGNAIEGNYGQVAVPKQENSSVTQNAPNAESVLPRNPADEIRKEIDNITNR